MTAATDLPNAGEPERRTGLARFGPFELDLAAAELRRDGTRVRVQDLPLRLLMILLERPGEIVTREELRERLWPQEFVDFEHGLNTAVRKLRTALGDSADQPRYIETLARRGYRFLAPVSWNGPKDEKPVVERAAPPARRRIAPILIAAAIVVAAMAALLVWRARVAQQRAAIDAIAVLPFTNSDRQSEHVSDGLTEILIDRLSGLQDMRVMARSTVFDYKGRKIAPVRAGRELNVGALVMGHVRRERDRYSVHVELIDARDGAQIWGDRYESSAAELASLHSRIAEDLSAQLREGLDAESRRSAARRYSSNPAAYQQYLLGLQAWNRRTPADLGRAIQHFNRAIEIDPQFAAAYAGLANTYGVMGGYGLIPPSEATMRVLAAARKTLELDPQNAEAYTSIATTSYRNLWDFDGAERDYRRAIALNPSYATAHQWYSDYLRSMGRFDEARRELDRAYALDPASRAIAGARCWSLYNERRYREAIATGGGRPSAQQRWPTCAMFAYFALGDFDSAFALMEASGVRHLPQLRDVYRRDGERGVARFYLDALLRHQQREDAWPVDIAALYAILGDADNAFLWLNKAYEHRVSKITSFHLEPAFDAIRNDPRFADLARRVGLPQSALDATARLAAQSPFRFGRRSAI